jgi:hypothetical protein
MKTSLNGLFAGNIPKIIVKTSGCNHPVKSTLYRLVEKTWKMVEKSLKWEKCCTPSLSDPSTTSSNFWDSQGSEV